jgi:aryl-alcohol dehydrogenase-like predicted oxidoreductase
MEYRNLGNSDLSVSEIGVGGNNFGRACDIEKTKEILNAALSLGINTVDTADIYGGGGLSEEYVGNAIKDQRDKWVLMTKFGAPNIPGNDPHSNLEPSATKEYINYAVEASLKRLQTTYIDVYQVHFPHEEIDTEETMAALNELIKAGKVRYIGCSNYKVWHMVQSQHAAKNNGFAEFISSQPPYSLVDRRVEKEHLPACKEYGVGIIPYSPLASGFLTGKYKKGQPAPKGSRFETSATTGYATRFINEKNYSILDKLIDFAENKKVKLSHLALKWLLANKQVATVIAGVTSIDQLNDNVLATSVSLSSDELETLNNITK